MIEVVVLQPPTQPITGTRAGYTSRFPEGAKAVASDGYYYFLGDIVESLFNEMNGKDGYIAFIPKEIKL